jgi:PAS domain S-box-containing protein
LSHVTSPRTFIVALGIGFLTGVALIPVAIDQFVGATLALGGLCIAAATALRAARAENKVETLQQALLDEQSYHAFVDAAAEGFFRTTRQGRYLIVNPALARIYGYDSPEQLRTELTDIGGTLYVDPNRRGEFQALMEERGTVTDFVSQIRRRNGSVIWIVENARKVTDDDDQFLFYEGTVQDITVQRESEEAIRRALRETQEAARAKAAFLAAMSHELKTPLNAVIGFADLMRQELFGPVNEPRYRSYIVDIHDNGRRLLTMINDILDLSRVEGGLLDLDEEALCLFDVVASAKDEIAEAKLDAAPIAVEVSPDLPLLYADRRRVRQILMHLLSNAVKFTPQDGAIAVRAELTQDGRLTVAVKDTGIGMEKGRIGHALEPFKQLDSRLARRFEGVGLGLPLANAFARLHNAQLMIDSMPGKGTTVVIAFPPGRTIVEREVLIA